MLEVTYSMLALTAVLLFPALVQYILREKKPEQQQQLQQPVEHHHHQPSLQQEQDQQQQQQQLESNESSYPSLSGREADDSTSNDITKCNSSSSGCTTSEPLSPASVVYMSFDCGNDAADMMKDKTEENLMSYSHESMKRRTFNMFPLSPDYYSSDESDELLPLEANQPEDFHKLLSQTGSEMMRSCLSIEDLVQAKIKHE